MSAPNSETGTSLPVRISTGVGLLGLVLLGIATAVGFLGAQWWVFDLAAALRVQYVLGFLLLAALFALTRRRALMVISLVGVIVNAALLVPLYLNGPEEVETDAPVLRIMFLNTQIRGADPGALIEDLRDADHDLIFLSAATDRWADALEAAAIPYTVVLRRPPGVDLELVVLSRTGLAVETSTRDFGAGGRDMAVQAVSLGDIAVHILAMHPVSPITPVRASMHSEQMAAIARWAADQSDPVLIVGDLNATPWSSDFQMLLEVGDLHNSQKGFGVLASWPAFLGPLGIPIDHALHSSELTTMERSLGPTYGSEHRSVQVTVAPVIQSSEG